jgi:DNA-binding response OmpR family regulator
MKTRILIVDDESEFTHMLRVHLEADGYYEVQEENDATNALMAAREFEPDLIILDIMMPELEGSDVAAKFRETSQFARTPIIFMTALVTGNETMGSTQPGCQTFLPKSTPTERLIDCIEEKLAKQSAVATR